MDSILLHLLAALCYGAAGAVGWYRCRQREGICLPAWLPLLYWLAVVVHAAAVVALLWAPPSGLRLGMTPVLSLTFWLAGALLAATVRQPGSGLWPLLIHAPLAALVALAVALFPTSSQVAAAEQPLLIAHLVIALLGYALFSVIAVYALLMTLVDRALHHHRLFRWLEQLPPLMKLEAQLFRWIALGVVLLTLTNVTGFFFTDWRWDHKTVFSLLAWGVFLVLLVGRWRYGWRGQLALRWLWTGLLFLTLAYLGFHFVRDVLLAPRR